MKTERQPVDSLTEALVTCLVYGIRMIFRTDMCQLYVIITNLLTHDVLPLYMVQN